MSSDSPDPEIGSDIDSRGSLGFGISAGLAASLVLAALSAFPLGALLLLLFVGLTLPLVLTIAIIWGQPNWRPFTIGALIPAVVIFCATVSCFVYLTFEGPFNWDDIDGAGPGVVSGLLLSAACGLLGQMTARRVGQNQLASESFEKFQFSIRGLLGLTTVVAVGLTLFFVIPVEFGTIGLLLVGLALPVVLVNGLVFGSPWWKTFSLGAFFPVALFFAVVVCYFVVAVFDGDWFDMGGGFDPGIRIAAFLTIGAGFGCGMLSVRIRGRMR